jgi:hypothetical protein
MNDWLLRSLWLVVVLALAGVIHWLSGINFFLCSALVAAAFMLNGLLAEWEDRRPGGFLNPKGNDEQ